MATTRRIDMQALVTIAKRYDLSYMGLFGSHARDEATPTSDVDLYVRFGRPVELFEVLALKHTLEDTLGLKVDLVAEEAVILHKSVRDSMLNNLHVIYV